MDIETKLLRGIVWFLVVLFGLAIIVGIAGKADAQQQRTMKIRCGERVKLVAFLKAQYKEHQRAIGTLNDKTIVEFFRNDDGSFSVIVSNTSGESCLIASGKNYYDIPKGKLKPEDAL